MSRICPGVKLRGSLLGGKAIASLLLLPKENTDFRIKEAWV